MLDFYFDELRKVYERNRERKGRPSAEIEMLDIALNDRSYESGYYMGMVSAWAFSGVINTSEAFDMRAIIMEVFKKGVNA